MQRENNQKMWTALSLGEEHMALITELLNLNLVCIMLVDEIIELCSLRV